MDADWSVELGGDVPALEFPWSSPDGTFSYVDLRHHPEQLIYILEANEYPELGCFLEAVNSPLSPLITAKCDVWTDDELAESERIYEATFKVCSYVDIIFASEEPRFSFETHEQFAKSVVREISTREPPSHLQRAVAELVVRRCWFHPNTCDSNSIASLMKEPLRAGFFITFYLVGYGGSYADARLNWAQGLQCMTPVLTQLAG
jgi:hypothetical protein